MLVKYPVIAVLRKISRPLAAVRSTRIHVALSKMENSYIEALIVVFGLRFMILKMVTPHCIKQDSSQYIYYSIIEHCICQSNIFKVTLHDVEGITEYLP